MKRICFYLLIIIILTGCSEGPIGIKGNIDSYNLKEITSFSFNQTQNPGLDKDYKGDISGNTISLNLLLGANITNLIAVFEITGGSVSVDGIEQENGITANDFTLPVIYTVTAADGSNREYIINVSGASIVTGLKVNTPTFSKDSGDFVNSETITISTTTEDATIVYTTDGSTPERGDNAYISPANVMLTGTTTLRAMAWKAGWEDSDIIQATFTLKTPDSIVVGLIQTEIDAAVAGETIYVPAGIYTENLTISKQIILLGAGNNTVIQSAGTADDPVIEVQSGGTSANDRLVIKNFYLSGGVHGAGAWGSGIHFSNTTEYTTIENVVAAQNEDYGIHFNVAGTVTDIIIKNCWLSNNGIHGLRIAGVTTPIGLTISNTSFEWNSDAGLMSYTSSITADITLDYCTFLNNAMGSHTSGDIVFSGLNGSISFSHITVTSNNCESGIRITGSKDGSNNPYDAGDMAFSDILIDGVQASAGTYPSAAFTFTRYADVSNVSFNNIFLNSTAPHGFFIGTVMGTNLDIGNMVFNGVFTDFDIKLGQHGNSGSYAESTINVVATEATFVGAISDPEIENRIYHNIDDNDTGTVTW